MNDPLFGTWDPEYNVRVDRLVKQIVGWRAKL